MYYPFKWCNKPSLIEPLLNCKWYQSGRHRTCPQVTPNLVVMMEPRHEVIYCHNALYELSPGSVLDCTAEGLEDLPRDSSIFPYPESVRTKLSNMIKHTLIDLVCSSELPPPISDTHMSTQLLTSLKHCAQSVRWFSLLVFPINCMSVQAKVPFRIPKARAA